ncbi:thy-1 membrane glycoprotein [Trichomycterus rosablanca]|uniref:thy-1 membrane glycoprotein n=1 Tax=Trichomycterus rosablanca TaxID=2290929 RepID=UPI002F35BED2
MMYYFILASFCLLGMTNSQTITDLTACVTKENNLRMECKFTLNTSVPTAAKCTYKTSGKVVATTDPTVTQDATYKNRGTASITNNMCLLELTGFPDGAAQDYECAIKQDKSVTKTKSVEKKSAATCSACKLMQLGGLTLLLALIFPLMSELL